jgi:hypothetical protein
MKIKRSLAATLVFLILLAMVYLIHVNFFRVDVVLYSAILDGLIAALIAAAILLRASYFDLFNSFEKIQIVIIWLLLCYAYAISIPTIIDRSLSFYILEKIQQRGGGIKLSSFEDVFKKEYVKEHRLVDVRLTEQQSSGTITIQNGCVKLTSRGDQLATFSRYFRQHFLPKKRLLMGEYTDDLTDPFRNSRNSVGYECK